MNVVHVVTFTHPEREVDPDEPITMVCSEGCGEVPAADMEKHATSQHKAQTIRVERRVDGRRR